MAGEGEAACAIGSSMPPNGRRVYAMEISPAYVDVAVERWQAETGRAAVLDGDSRSFAEVKQERIGAPGIQRCAAVLSPAA
jgi:hypothetical protein